MSNTSKVGIVAWCVACVGTAVGAVAYGIYGVKDLLNRKKEKQAWEDYRHANIEAEKAKQKAYEAVFISHYPELHAAALSADATCDRKQKEAEETLEETVFPKEAKARKKTEAKK